ncbi:MAG TPA: hybrid sensor histidine kinase/response regulator, partial [Ramlibacter sp.]|nr:hybrid sensor histidine kinase/response regulator [Ramlibacter sp.]
MNTPLATAAPNRHILIVDDLPSIHEDFRKILAPAPVADKLRDLEAAVFGMAVAPALPGFQLDSAFQGQQAIAMVEAAVRAGRPYALAFVDMLMPPGLDGVETIERLWRIDPDIQVVICTAYSDHPWDPVLRRLDLQDRLLVIKKPCDAVEVSQLARALTARWTIARQAAEHIATLERAVQSLTAREAELRQSKAEADAFAHSVSQHLRSPLMAMSALGNLLAKELQRHDDESALRHLSRIRTNAEFGKRVIDGLLGLARIGQAQLSMEPLDLSEIASAMLAEVCRASAGPTVSIAVQAGLRALGDRRLIQA